MENTFLNKYKKIVLIKITGRNINRYIKTLIIKKIDYYNLNIINRNTCIINLSYDNYLKLNEERNVLYKIEIIKNEGILKIKDNVKKNSILFISLIIGILLIKLLSNVIFNIEVIHNNSDIRKLIYKELESYNIKKYTFKKNYDTLEKIKKEILESNKNKLEWLEIEESGTKYIIRVEERKIDTIEKSDVPQNIVASKSGIIRYIKSSSGEIVKRENNYVTKGEVIISGNITLPNNSIVQTHASGKVMAEVWKNVEVDFPKQYKEEILTGKEKEVYVLNILNKRISLFDFNSFSTLRKEEKLILRNNLNNIRFTKEHQYELNVIDEVYTIEECISKGINLAIEKINNNLKEEEKILSYKLLNNYDNTNSIHLKLFFSVLENIAEEKIIEKVE